MMNQPTGEPGFSIDDFVKGHLSAFGNVYNHYHSGVIRLARELLQDPVVVETIVTDSFLKLWIKHADLDTPQNIEAFLHISVQRTSFNYLKKIEHLTLEQLQKMQAVTAANKAAQKTKNSEEVKAIILGWFDKLPAFASRTAQMVWGQDFSDEEAAERLNTNADMIKEEKQNCMRLIMEDWFLKTEKELAAFKKLLEHAKG